MMILCMIHLQVLALLSFSYLGTDCSVLPSTIVQAEGLDATFLCQLPANGLAIEWQINETSLRNVNSSQTLRKEGRGNGTEALIIPALSRFNGTSIVCIRYNIIEPNGTVEFEVIESPPALLFVQGPLEAIINFAAKAMSSAIQLSWQPPFSLNLTTAEPDIVYCVNVFNITDERDYLISNCSVFETYYNFVVENPDPKDTFQFIVTPRSNIEGARSGNTKEINATFFHLVEAAVSVSPSSIMTTSCCLVLSSQDLSIQLSTMYTPDRAGPTSDPVEPLLLQIIPVIVSVILVVFVTIIIITFVFVGVRLKNKRGPGQSEDTTRKAERIEMNSCGAYNFIVPKTVVMEENPAYATIKMQ